MLDPYGIKFTYEVKSMMMGKKGLEAIEIMLKHYNLENDPAEFYQNREEILDELFQDCDLMPGALRLVKHLKKHQIPMAIATSSHKRHFDLKTLKHKELFKEMFQAVITGDEVVHSKPNPEIFVKAAETLAGGEGYNPAHYLVRICCFGFLKKMKLPTLRNYLMYLLYEQFLLCLGYGRFSAWRQGINSGWDACGLGI